MDEGLSFEQALSKLEEITGMLQKGGLKLEEMLALFEEGAALAKLCHQRLNAAELKLTQLQAATGEESKRDGDDK